MEILTTHQHDMWEHDRLQNEDIQWLTARVNTCLMSEFTSTSILQKKHLVGDTPSLG